MDLAAVAQALLAVVLAASGAAKALDQAGTRSAAVALGVPPGLSGPTAVLLPALELLAVALLLLAPVPGLVLAVLLLTAFTAAVGRALLRGERPTCRCFGRLGSARVSGRTLLRNGLLLAAALGALALGGAAPALVPGLVGGALGVLVLALEGTDGRSRPPDLPALEVPLLGGGRTSLAALVPPGRPLLLVVLAPGCTGCTSLLPDVRSWAADRCVAVLGLTSPGLVRDLVGDLAVPVLLDESGQVRAALGVPQTPGAVLVHPDRRLSRPAVGVAAVRRLAERAR